MNTKIQGNTRGIRAGLSALILTSLVVLSATGQARELDITVRADHPGDTISRYLYGQFSEHLGRGVYGGIWVGEDSDIPNTRGLRNDVVGALRDLHIPVIRWPGGCFADEYNWRDGIGPRDKRPVRINTHWGWVPETNAFGTHEYFDLLEQVGSEAYIAGNVGSATPREMAQWLEYITADNDTTLARLRRANGRDKPWHVAFFGIGNETWGCGGNMTPAYYTDLYKRYATFLKAPRDNRTKKVASGGNDAHTDWTETLSSGVHGNIDGISHHYYTTPTGIWEHKGSAIAFPEKEWISTFQNTMRIDGYLKANEAVLERNDPDNRIGLYLDEWGTWYDPEQGREAGFLYQQNSIRDALVAALNFNIFHRHTKRLRMANIAQTVNVLQAMILTRGAKMIRTPTYYAFQMYIPFQDATFVPLDLGDVPQYAFGDYAVPQVSASAALTKDGRLVVALVNLSASDAIEIKTKVDGFAAGKATGTVLTGGTIDAHNTFDKPDTVKPAPLAVGLKGGSMSVKLPARSVSVITLSR